MTKHQHKYRTNIDGLTIAGVSNNAGIYTKPILSPYITIIFCEGCGDIKYDANRPAKNLL